MQNIEIMPRYSTIYCGKTNIPFGNLAFFLPKVYQEDLTEVLEVLNGS